MSATPALGPPVSPSLRSGWWICLLLFASTITLYWPVRTFELISWDDPEYVTANPHVKAGFTRDSVRAAFVASGGNWIPLTHLSHTLDYKLFGENWGFHHLTSVLLHGVATILLFLFLWRATGYRWPSAFVAVVFALHPLHVESVAWVAERKDVLCALFWFLALLLWVRYTERPGAGRYLAAMVALALGVMSKPMIVSFPVVLILLDIWPLRRPFCRTTVLEKVPAAILAAVCSVATFVAQHDAGYVQSVAGYPVGLRLQNAIVTLVHYQWDLVWPSGLVFGYPYPLSVPMVLVMAASGFLVLTALAVLRLRKQYPYLAVGWFWFVITLLPVLGLVQVGGAARADRYMYVPSVGLLIMLAWGAKDLLNRRAWLRRPAAGIAVLLCGALAWAAREQLGYWRASEPLYRRSIAIVPQNYLAWGYLASLLASDPARADEALEATRTVASLRPGFAQHHENVSILAARAGLWQEAVAAGEAAIRVGPGDAEAWYVAGAAWYGAEKPNEASTRLNKALLLNPDHVAGNYLLSLILVKGGRLAEALPHLQTAVRVDPEDAGVHGLLGATLTRLGQPEQALRHLEESVRLQPEQWEAQLNLGTALITNPHRQFDAVSHLEESLRLNPANPMAHRALGSVLLRVGGRGQQAIAHFEAALQLAPDPALRRNVDLLIARQR